MSVRAGDALSLVLIRVEVERAATDRLGEGALVASRARLIGGLASQAELSVEACRASSRSGSVLRTVKSRLAELAIEAACGCVGSSDAIRSAGSVATDGDGARLASFTRLAGAITIVERAWRAHRVMSASLVLALVAWRALHAIRLSDVGEIVATCGFTRQWKFSCLGSVVAGR